MGAVFVICSVLKQRFGTDRGASIFFFGPISVLMIVGISILTSLIATFLPVYNIARKKPVESIRSLEHIFNEKKRLLVKRRFF